MKKPNLLFIYTDQQAINTLAAYGNTKIQMPNLNKFADQATVFEQAYVTQPVCTPSRSSLLTGQWPHTNGCIKNNIPLTEDTRCLPEMLKGAEYVTAHHGKWHLGDEIYAQHGFDEWISTDDGYVAYYSSKRNKDDTSTYHKYLIKNGFKPENDRFTRAECCKLPEEYGKPAYLAGEASRFIKENKDNPFVLYVNFLEPHMPYFSPRDNQYDPAEVDLPPNFNRLPDESNPVKHNLLKENYYKKGNSGLALKTENDWRRMIANYWGLCSLVDTHVGTILDTLAEYGLDDNTIVVYTSDHGDMMGAHRLLAKCVMFEEATRVPFLIRLPGQTEGRRVGGPVSQIDIIPTLLDLMGQAQPDYIQGKSLTPYLGKDGLTQHNHDAFIEWNGPNNGAISENRPMSNLMDITDKFSIEQLQSSILDPVRTVVTPDGWKFNRSAVGESELYNLSDDPYETCNLIDEPKYADLLQNLSQRIDQWQRESKDVPELKSKEC